LRPESSCYRHLTPRHLDSSIVYALLLLAVASVAVALFRRLGLGSVPGLLVAGVVVGPHSPGPPFTEHAGDVRHFAELGMVLLLFVIGLDMNPARLWSMRRALVGLGSLQILLTGLTIPLCVSLGMASWATALLIGLPLSLSSTAFVIQLPPQRGELASPENIDASLRLGAEALQMIGTPSDNVDMMLQGVKKGDISWCARGTRVWRRRDLAWIAPFVQPNVRRWTI